MIPLEIVATQTVGVMHATLEIGGNAFPMGSRDQREPPSTERYAAPTGDPRGTVTDPTATQTGSVGQEIETIVARGVGGRGATLHVTPPSLDITTSPLPI